MPKDKPTDYLSLAHAMDCLLSGTEFGTDVAKPTKQFDFPEHTVEFESLIQALIEGRIRSQGRLGVVNLDLPAIDVEMQNGSVALSCRTWRQSEDVLMASGSESASSRIPPDAWWYDGVIWEQSTIWVNNPINFEERCKNLPVVRHVPYLPDRPYSFERAICYVDVDVVLSDLVAWSGATSRAKKLPYKRNERGAGMKPTENYKAITDHLRQLVAQGREWETWMLVWVDVRDLFKDPDVLEKSEQPYKKLTEHLKKHEPELYAALRARIASVRN